MRTLTPAALACAAVLLAAACGGGSEPAAPGGTATPVAGSTAPGTEAASTAEAPATETASAATQPPATSDPAPEALPGLPGFTAGYADWPRLNAELVPARDGDPHLGTKDVYERVGPAPDGVYPDGAVIVKEITRPDADFVGVVAVMRKVEGSNPDGGDWEFVEYERSAPDEPFTVLAEGQICTSCHMGAAGTDFVWITTLGLARR